MTETKGSKDYILRPPEQLVGCKCACSLQNHQGFWVSINPDSFTRAVRSQSKNRNTSHLHLREVINCLMDMVSLSA